MYRFYWQLRIKLNSNECVKENVQTFTKFCQKITKKLNFNRTIATDRFRTYGPHQCGAPSQIYLSLLKLKHTKGFE